MVCSRVPWIGHLQYTIITKYVLTGGGIGMWNANLVEMVPEHVMAPPPFLKDCTQPRMSTHDVLYCALFISLGLRWPSETRGEGPCVDLVLLFKLVRRLSIYIYI